MTFLLPLCLCTALTPYGELPNLAARDFKQREAASERLKAWDGLAVATLEEGVRHAKDAEVLLRCKLLLRAYAWKHSLIFCRPQQEVEVLVPMKSGEQLEWVNRPTDVDDTGRTQLGDESGAVLKLRCRKAGLYRVRLQVGYPHFLSGYSYPGEEGLEEAPVLRTLVFTLWARD